MDNLSGAYDLVERVRELEYKFQQLKKDIDVLFEITSKIRPKYYKMQDSDLKENNA